MYSARLYAISDADKPLGFGASIASIAARSPGRFRAIARLFMIVQKGGPPSMRDATLSDAKPMLLKQALLLLNEWDKCPRQCSRENISSFRQYRHYAEHYSRSDFLIVECGGTPIGRLCIDRGHATNLRIVDIALLPEARGAGIGSALMQAIMEEARYQAKKTSIHVEQENRAKRLYERLGFRPVTQTGPYWLMEARTDVSADI